MGQLCPERVNWVNATLQRVCAKSPRSFFRNAARKDAARSSSSCLLSTAARDALRSLIRPVRSHDLEEAYNVPPRYQEALSRGRRRQQRRRLAVAASRRHCVHTAERALTNANIREGREALYLCRGRRRAPRKSTFEQEKVEARAE